MTTLVITIGRHDIIQLFLIPIGPSTDTPIHILGVFTKLVYDVLNNGLVNFRNVTMESPIVVNMFNSFPGNDLKQGFLEVLPRMLVCAATGRALL